MFGCKVLDILSVFSLVFVIMLFDILQLYVGHQSGTTFSRSKSTMDFQSIVVELLLQTTPDAHE
ncbi:MAG: hypothetical protein V3U87_11480 [Methylococcaceae bacterium]